jgi:hypothetical protein
MIKKFSEDTSTTRPSHNLQVWLEAYTRDGVRFLMKNKVKSDI